MANLEFFLKNGSKLKFKKGETLIRGGEEPQGIYFLESGIVKMSTFFENGTEITYNFFKPGSFFPMIWAIVGNPNTYDFQAVTDTVVYRVSKKEVLNFLEKEDDVYKDLVRRILLGFDSLLGSFPYLLSGSSIKRVAAAILFLSRRFGERIKDGIILKIKVRHEDLAGMAALTRETVSLVIEKLEKKKVIIQKNRFIVIQDLEELKRQADMEDFFLPPSLW